MLEIGGAVLVLRRADGDEDDLGLANGARQRRRKRQPPFLAVAPHQLLEARLVNRDLPPLEHPNLGVVVVDADDVISAFGEAGTRDEAHIPGSDDSDFQSVSRTIRPKAEGLTA